MMTFSSIDALVLTALFIVPGFLISTVRSRFVPRRLLETQIRVIEFLALSCMNHVLWFWFFGLLFGTGFRNDHPVWTMALLIFPGLISPIMLGLLLGRMDQMDWARKFLSSWGFTTIHQIPSAWDFHFSRALPYWVIVTLRDGSRTYGLYGYRSFAGDDPKERDLYLEAIYRPNENGTWVREEGSGGILLRSEQIMAIEFKEMHEVVYVDK